jgi:putative membrane protein
MDSLTKAVLLSWDLRIEVIGLLLTLGALHFIGWRNLRRRGRTRFANGWRLASYFVGLFVLGISILSPIDVLSSQLFLMHMVQHLLMMMAAAPLLMLANPFPTFLWALPRDLRTRVGRWFLPGHPLYRTLEKILRPGVTWLVFVTVYLGWHDPELYNLALRNAFVHDLEHITFFGVAILFWWRITSAGPQIGKRLPAMMRAAYAVTLVPVNMLAGVAITFSESPIYTHYTMVPRLYGISVMDDQTWAGLIMWIPGSMMYILAAIFLIGVHMNRVKKMEQRNALAPDDESLKIAELQRQRHAQRQQAQQLRSSEV